MTTFAHPRQLITATMNTIPTSRLFKNLCLTLLLVAPIHQAAACSNRDTTPPMSPGPHDYSHVSTESTLWKEGDAGEPLSLRLRVLDTCSKPVAGAKVQILHANTHGDHEPNRWRTTLTANDRGEVKVVTVFPGYAGWIARHIHVVVTHPEHEKLVTRLLFKNDPESDSVEQPELAMVLEEIQRGETRGWVAGYELVVAPK